MSLATEGRNAGAPVTEVTGAPAPARKRRRGPHRWRMWERIILSFGGVVALALLLQWGTIAFGQPNYLPPFFGIFERFLQFFAQPEFYAQVWATISGFLIGLGIATVLGIGLGVLFGLWEVSYRSSRTVIELLRPIPPVALIPVFILLFKTGPVMKTLIVLFACVWPIMFNALYGVRNVDPQLKDMARSFGRSRWDIIRSIIIPAALPMMWTGVRIASTISLIVVITVELLVGGTVGIGGIINDARATGDDVYARFAAIIAAGVLGLLVNIGLGAVERRFFSWSTTTKEG